MDDFSKEKVIDMFVLGLDPRSISYATGLRQKEVRTVCEEYEATMHFECMGFMQELKDKGFISKNRWRWKWKPGKIKISLS